LAVLSSDEARDAVRKEAESFLARHRICEPPFPVDQALQAQQLRLAEISLEEALRRMGVDGESASKIDAMLDVRARSVALKENLHRHGRKWGCVHEVAHSVIPWHVDLLYYCPILLLPPKIQKQMELEADAFTSDCLFLGGRFLEEAKSRPFGVRPVIGLADEYQTSIHSALRRYVEENPAPCCLLVWRIPEEGRSADPTLSLHYYVSSTLFRGGLRVGQVIGPDHVITQAYLKLRDEGGLIVEHELGIGSGRGRLTCCAETFFNSYTLFTMAWHPKPAPA
jgi:hypothetical protein